VDLCILRPCICIDFTYIVFCHAESTDCALQELWCCALAAANPSSSSSSSAAASQVLGQLLVPGQVCLSSLVAALAYHGAQMSEAEAAAASLSQLQVSLQLNNAELFGCCEWLGGGLHIAKHNVAAYSGVERLGSCVSPL
jgi:hypothetical protein